MVEEHRMIERRRIEKDSGRNTRENVGMSSEMCVRITQAENPRISKEGSSAWSKSGPKERQKCVSDGQQVKIPVPTLIAKEEKE